MDYSRIWAEVQNADEGTGSVKVKESVDGRIIAEKVFSQCATPNFDHSSKKMDDDFELHNSKAQCISKNGEIERIAESKSDLDEKQGEVKGDFADKVIPVDSRGQDAVKFMEESIRNHKRTKEYQKVIDEQQEIARSQYLANVRSAQYNELCLKEPKHLPDMRTVDAEYPTHVFGAGAQKWIESMTDAFNVHPCVPGSLLLGVLSIASQGRIRIKRHGNHIEPFSLYFLIMMPSGKMKSPMLEAAMGPIKKIEEELQAAYRKKSQRNNYEREIYQAKIKKVKRQSVDSDGVKECVDEIMKLADQMPRKEHLPKLVTFKFTIEGLEQESERQDGRYAVVGAELGSFRKLPANRDDLFLKSYSNEDYSYNKAGETIHIPQPSLTVLIATQEKTALKLLGNSTFQEDGLLSRFTYIVPPEYHSIMHEYEGTTEVSHESNFWLESVVRGIMDVTRPSRDGFTLTIEDNALANWDVFANEILGEAQKKDHPLPLKSYLRKLAGTALRFAGLVHVMKAVESGLSFNRPVERASVIAGIELAKYYAQHAEVALDMRANENLEDAWDILRYLKAVDCHEITVREICRKKHWLVDRVFLALKLLEKHNYVAICRQGKSNICLIHPHVKWFQYT